MNITIDTKAQRLYLYDSCRLLREFIVSTAANGVGEQINSGCTPRGKHVIRAKIGADLDINTRFKGRRPVGVFNPLNYASNQSSDEDFILSRILWLSGLERGFNRLGAVDTMRRYIYIHGSPDSHVTGLPNSKGCIRMRASDIAWLFERVAVGCPVLIC